MTVPFELGEQKHVRLRVCSCENGNFLITAASLCSRYYRGAKEPEEYRTFGNPADDILDTLIQPKKKGMYELLVMYEILDEKLIAEVEVAVK